MALHYGPGGPGDDLDHAQELLKLFHLSNRENKTRDFKPYLVMAHNVVVRVMPDCSKDEIVRANALLGAIVSTYKDFFGNDTF